MSASTAVVPDLRRGQGRNLALATLAFAISFWAWNIMAPLGVRYTEQMGLSAGQKSLLVAIPVLVGSLGRIVTGALTDRFGGRLMFTVLMLASAPFVLLVAVAGDGGSYGLMLVFGFFLAIAGTTFAVGLPFVTAWFEADRRGFATGVFGAGMGGTALSAFFTPRLVTWIGYAATHLLIAAALVVVAATSFAGSSAWVRALSSPGSPPHPRSGSAASPASSARPAAWAASSRPWSWA